MEIKGRFGCAFTATPASLYGQFSSYAFASLLYDFVVVNELDHCIALHTIGSHPKESMRRAFTLFKDKGIAIDSTDLSPGVMTTEQILQGYSNDEVAAQKAREFEQAQENWKAAEIALEALRQFIRKKLGVHPQARISIPSEYSDEFMNAVWSAKDAEHEAKRLSTMISLETCGYKIDSGHLVKWGDEYNDEFRPLLEERRVPLLSQNLPVSTPTRALSGGTETYAVALKNLPFPSDLPVDEFVDFRNDKKVRKSISAFRELADKIADGGAPATYVLEEMSDQYNDYAAQVHSLKGRRVLANVKFIASNLFGFAEDVAKLRLENFAKRPFEIVDYFLDYKDKEKGMENSPFFFVHEKAPQ